MARVCTRLIESRHVILVITPNALHHTLLNVSFSLSFASQGCETNLVKAVWLILSDGFDFFL